MAEQTPDWVTDEIGGNDEFFLGLMKERTPERADELQQVVDQHTIHFAVDPDSDRCRFSSQARTGKIIVGLNGSARLMGHTFAYCCAHYGLLKNLKAILDGTSPLPDYERNSKAAAQLLAWALTGDIRSKLSSFEQSLVPAYIPDDLVALLNACLPERQRDRAGEVFANAIVWILYHEVAHIQLGHVACEGFESIEQEKEADRKAAEWMLSAEQIEDTELCKRQLGVATALGWLTASTVFLGPGSMKTHPAAYDRLYQILDQYIAPEHEDVWLFVQMILVLHLMHAGATITADHVGPPLKEKANRLIDVIAEAGRK